MQLKKSILNKDGQLPTIPEISTKQTTASHLKLLNIKQDHYMVLEI